MKTIFLIPLFFYVTILTAQNPNDYEETNLVKVGQPAPDFSYINEAGKKVQLSHLQGNVVLLHFFTTWCAPCIREMPMLETEVWDLYKEKKFTVLSFGIGHNDEELNKWASAKKLSFPIYADREKRIYDLYATSYIPRSYIIDENGTIVYALMGYDPVRFAQLTEEINSRLTK